MPTSPLIAYLVGFFLVLRLTTYLPPFSVLFAPLPIQSTYPLERSRTLTRKSTSNQPKCTFRFNTTAELLFPSNPLFIALPRPFFRIP